MTMAEKDKNEEVMHIEEDTDGTATVELPDSVEFSQGGEAGEPRQADDGDVDHPDDSEAVRAARRARRRSKKDLIRKTNEEKDVRLGMLQRQNEELMNRLSNVERKTQQHDLGRLDKAIEDQGVRLEYAKMKLSEATANGNGDDAVQAQELLYEARKQLDELSAVKRQANQPQRVLQRADEEVEVLEDAQGRQIEGQPRDERDQARAGRAVGASEVDADEEVGHRAPDEEPQKAPIPPRVEQVAREEDDDVLRAERTVQRPIQRKDRGQEDREDE
jgi:hypothetical protein